MPGIGLEPVFDDPFGGYAGVPVFPRICRTIQSRADRLCRQISSTLALPLTRLRINQAPMKILVSILVGLLVIIAVGLLLQSVIPSCQCVLEGGCRGCGGPVGNAIAGVSFMSFVLGAMGFVLLIWFGIPMAILGLIVYGIFRLFRKKTESQ